MEIIKSNMIFYNFEDFYKNAIRIKDEYSKLDVSKKEIYKMYVYSNSLITLGIRNKIWEYLNEPFGSCYYVSYEMLGAYL